MAPPSPTRSTSLRRAVARAHRRASSVWLGLLCVPGAMAACHETVAVTLDASPYGDAPDGSDAAQVADRAVQDAPFDELTDRPSGDDPLADVVHADSPVHVTHVFAVSGYSFAVAGDGTLWGWGSNESGTFLPINISNRFSDFRRRPQRIDGVSHVRDLQYNGARGICALNGVADDGRVYCWGYGALIAYGEIGRDTIAQWSSPRPMGTISDVLSMGQAGLVTRPDHSFWSFHVTDARWTVFPRFPDQAIQRVDPGIYWLTTGLVAATTVPGFDHSPQHVDGIAELVGDYDHACMRRVDGHVLCWGMNHLSQGGVPTRDSALCEYDDDTLGPLQHRSQLCLPQPTEVPGIDDAVKISTGTSRTCVIRRGGSVWCWGRDYALDDGLGVIGDGVAPDELCVPAHAVGGVRQEFPDEAQPCRQRPTRVLGIDDAVDLSVGTDHHCVVRASGAVWCWGDNHRGQLGDGATGSHGVPVPVRWY